MCLERCVQWLGYMYFGLHPPLSFSNSPPTSTPIQHGASKMTDTDDEDYEVFWCDVDSDDDSISSMDFVDERQTSYTNGRHVFIRVGVYTSRPAAITAKDTFDGTVHKYRTRYKSANMTGTSYTCKSHVGCLPTLKIVERKLYDRWELLEGGVHATVVKPVEIQGISSVLKPEVDSLLEAGLGAGKLRTILLVRYTNKPDMLAHVPSPTQIANRKAYLVRTRVGGWELETFAAIMEWVSGKECTTKEAFDAINGSSFTKANKLLVLECFQHKFVDDDGVDRASFGIVFTSKLCFQNLADAIAAQGSKLVIATDGTYRIHFGGWTLVDCGTVCISKTLSNDYVHRFVPFVYMFVRTKTIAAYETMFV